MFRSSYALLAVHAHLGSLHLNVTTRPLNRPVYPCSNLEIAFGLARRALSSAPAFSYIRFGQRSSGCKIRKLFLMVKLDPREIRGTWGSTRSKKIFHSGEENVGRTLVRLAVFCTVFCALAEFILSGKRKKDSLYFGILELINTHTHTHTKQED